MLMMSTQPFNVEK